MGGLERRRKLGLYYRAAQVLHAESMAVFQLILPAFVTGSEFLIISCLFQAVRIRSTSGPLVAANPLLVASIAVVILKTCLELAAKLTEFSQDFSRLPFPRMDGKGGIVSREDMRFLKSCKPLPLRVGGTFTINRETFPTVAHNILINNLVTLLISF